MTASALVVAALRPDPDQAQDWVRAELAKREYQPTLLERVIGWFMDFLQGILDTASGFGRLDPAIALVALAALVIGLAVVLARLRPDPTRRTQPGPVLAEARVSAAEHRALAERARAEGRFDDAVIEAMRAIAVGLVERAVLDDRPAATAREVAADAATAFPAYGDRLRGAADRFDTVRYGDRHADRASADELLDLEASVRRTRPVEAAGAGPVLAVPR